MSEPAYTLETDKIGSFVMATWICESCNREWYVDAAVPKPELCPFCGENV